MTKRFQIRSTAAPAILALLLNAPPAFAAEPQLVSRVEPDFPREALQAGAEKGRVKARMTLSPSGEVTRVEVLEAAPRRVFDRAVVKTLAQWRYNAGPDGRQVDVDIEFRR